MNEVTTRTCTEWAQYIEHDGSIKVYTCPECKGPSHMVRRIVTEPVDGSHKEYKMVCDFCGHQSTVHLRKSLTRSVWESELKHGI